MRCFRSLSLSTYVSSPSKDKAQVLFEKLALPFPDHIQARDLHAALAAYLRSVLMHTLSRLSSAEERLPSLREIAAAILDTRYSPRHDLMHSMPASEPFRREEKGEALPCVAAARDGFSLSNRFDKLADLSAQRIADAVVALNHRVRSLLLADFVEEIALVATRGNPDAVPHFIRNCLL